ncbi:MAG TPA: hypothetical protein VGE26_03775 [Sphingobacteriaceae bacterium]
MSSFFLVMIDGQVTTFEKSRVISIEPYDKGTKITIEASHAAEEPITYYTPEEYDKVMSAYLS